MTFPFILLSLATLYMVLVFRFHDIDDRRDLDWGYAGREAFRNRKLTVSRRIRQGRSSRVTYSMVSLG